MPNDRVVVIHDSDNLLVKSTLRNDSDSTTTRSSSSYSSLRRHSPTSRSNYNKNNSFPPSPQRRSRFDIRHDNMLSNLKRQREATTTTKSTVAAAAAATTTTMTRTTEQQQQQQRWKSKGNSTSQSQQQQQPLEKRKDSSSSPLRFLHPKLHGRFQFPNKNSNKNNRQGSTTAAASSSFSNVKQQKQHPQQPHPPSNNCSATSSASPNNNDNNKNKSSSTSVLSMSFFVPRKEKVTTTAAAAAATSSQQPQDLEQNQEEEDKKKNSLIKTANKGAAGTAKENDSSTFSGDGGGDNDDGAVPKKKKKEKKNGSTTASSSAAAAAASPTANTGSSFNSCLVTIGTRVEIYWDGEDEYFAGTLTKPHPQNESNPRMADCFYIEYDDGDKGWIHLDREIYRLLLNMDHNDTTTSSNNNTTSELGNKKKAMQQQAEQGALSPTTSLIGGGDKNADDVKRAGVKTSTPKSRDDECEATQKLIAQRGGGVITKKGHGRRDSSSWSSDSDSKKPLSSCASPDKKRSGGTSTTPRSSDQRSTEPPEKKKKSMTELPATRNGGAAATAASSPGDSVDDFESGVNKTTSSTAVTAMSREERKQQKLAQRAVGGGGLVKANDGLGRRRESSNSSVTMEVSSSSSSSSSPEKKARRSSSSSSVTNSTEPNEEEKKNAVQQQAKLPMSGGGAGPSLSSSSLGDNVKGFGSRDSANSTTTVEPSTRPPSPEKKRRGTSAVNSTDLQEEEKKFEEEKNNNSNRSRISPLPLLQQPSPSSSSWNICRTRDGFSHVVPPGTTTHTATTANETPAATSPSMPLKKAILAKSKLSSLPASPSSLKSVSSSFLQSVDPPAVWKNDAVEAIGHRTEETSSDLREISDPKTNLLQITRTSKEALRGREGGGNSSKAVIIKAEDVEPDMTCQQVVKDVKEQPQPVVAAETGVLVKKNPEGLFVSSTKKEEDSWVVAGCPTRSLDESSDSETDEEELMDWASKMFGITSTTLKPPIARRKANSEVNEATGRSPPKIHIRTCDLHQNEYIPISEAVKLSRRRLSSSSKIVPDIPVSRKRVHKEIAAEDEEEVSKRRKEEAKPLSQAEIKSILARDLCPAAASAHWVRRSMRQPSRSALDSPKVKALLQTLRSNDTDMIVLKMKKYVNDPNAPQIVLDAVLDALEENTNCESLYIQNFNEGMRDPQILRLLEILKRPSCKIWCLNIGETYKVKHNTWKKFADGLADTKITHMYASEHIITPELKEQIRSTVRDNRSKHNMHCDPENLDTIIQCTHCWWNPINTKSLRPYLKKQGFEYILNDKDLQGLRGSTGGADLV